jgi:hypothetical protein
MIEFLKKKTHFVIIATTVLMGMLLLCAPIHAQEIQRNANCGSNISLGSSTGCDKPGAAQGSDNIERLITTIINVFSAIVGSIAVIMIIIGGFRYVTSAGDSNNVSGAKNTILYAIVGLVIVVFAQIIVRFVLQRI